MGATTVIAGVGAAGALAGGASSLMGAFGSKKSSSGSSGAAAAMQAAQIQADAANRSSDLQMQMYRESVAREAPWVGAGTAAVNRYAGLLKLPGYETIDPTEYLRSTPGYNWQLGQGVNALDRSAASKGMLLSGPQAKAVTKYGQGLADTTYNSLMDRLFGLSNQGQNAASLTGNQGIATGQNVGNAYMTGANAQAQGLYNAYNARESAYANQQNNLYGGLGMLTNSLGKLGGAIAPYASNWWSGGNSGQPSYTSPDYYPGGYGYQNYYS